MVNALRNTVALILSAAITTAGCATTGAVTVPMSVADTGGANQRVLAEYVQKLPPGTAIRVGRSNGHSVRGTLIKGTDQSIFIQPKTRLPEPLIEIPLSDVLQVTPESHKGNSVGRAIGAGAAAGAAATLAIFLIMFAVYGD